MMMNRKRKMYVVIWALFLCLVYVVPFAEAVEGPFIFDWTVRNAVIPGFEAITPIPFVGDNYAAYSYIYEDIYEQMFSTNRPLGLFIGGTDPNALSTVMGLAYVPRLDFVLADFEDVNKDAEMLEVIRQVRSHWNHDVNSAYIGNYRDYPGTTNYAEQWPGTEDRADRDTFYRTSGLNVAQPSCYPYEYYSIHTWAWQWGTNISPNKRSALFWAPLEHFSVAKRALPAGHLLIPWTSRFVAAEAEVYDAPVPTREDVRAMIQHMRLRGADGYYRFCGILDASINVDPNNNIENMWDSLRAWKSLDKVFEGIASVSILNLDTNKKGGIEWSGVQKGSKIAILVSNLSNSIDRVALPSIPGLPAYSDYVAAGEHDLTLYDVIIPTADVCVKNNGTITDALYTSWFGDSDNTGPYCYLKFDLAAIAPEVGFMNIVKSLKLSTNAPAVSGSLGSYMDLLYSVHQDDWTESGITWANKPATVSQLSSWATPTSAGWLEIESPNMTTFLEQQVNSDGTASFAIHDLDAARTNQQYQHYYSKDESEADCFRLVVEYEPSMTATHPTVAIITPFESVCVSESNIRSSWYITSYWYGHVANYMKYDLTELKPPTGYKTVVTYISNIGSWQTTSSTGDFYSDAFYESADTWDPNTIIWSARPLPGTKLVSWLFPGIYIYSWDIPSTPAWQSYAQNEANGDGIMSLCLQDVDGSVTTAQYHGYYNFPSPTLTIAYYFVLKEPPVDCEGAKSQLYILKGDVNGDCYVDFKDFSIIAERWLE